MTLLILLGDDYEEVAYDDVACFTNAELRKPSFNNAEFRQPSFTEELLLKPSFNEATFTTC